ncbi:MAG: hypothetical protein M1823_005564 [Watsoniomyces obsoletus]|nr:MAG: hypothetical protein M1823_005564 [Watsoniomyces obsoletus]
MRFLTLVLTATSLGSTLAVPVRETQSNSPRNSRTSGDERNDIFFRGVVTGAGGTVLAGGIGALVGYKKLQAARQPASPPSPPSSIRPFHHADYPDYFTLEEEIARRTINAQPRDQYGYDWIAECVFQRFPALWWIMGTESEYRTTDDILRDCSQEYFTFVKTYGPANAERLPLPTAKSEEARAERLKKELGRRVKTDPTPEEGTETTPSKFAGVRIPNLKTGENLAAMKQGLAEMRAQAPQAVKNIPKYAVSSLRNVPNSPALRYGTL